jgi:hypothetical protein
MAEKKLSRKELKEQQKKEKFDKELKSLGAKIEEKADGSQKPQGDIIT